MTAIAAADLQQAARDHLWMHFTRMSGYASNEVPIIVRGDGCYLEDANGKRYLDALAGLFSVNIGYGFGEEIGQAALAQMKELPFYTNWSYAHPRAIELASELASLAPGDLNRAFFVSGGSEAVESAWKLARQYYLARGGKRIDGRRDAARRARRRRRRRASTRRSRARSPTTARRMGALSINGIPALRRPFEPLVPEVRHVKNTNRYHRPPEETEAEFTAMLLENLEDSDRRDGAGDGLPRPHGARPERGRRLHAAGGLLARRPRALRPLRHPALRRRGDHRRSAASATGSRRSATTSGRTSSAAPRASPPRTRRSAP